MYSKEELLDGLNTEIVGKKLFLFDSLDSTNTCAKMLAETDMEEGAVVLADYQTEGKGRLGRQWLSDPGKNLLLSAIFRPSIGKEQAGLLTFFAAVSVARSLEAVTHLPVECKWPNDLLITSKKCCGILLENSFSQDTIAYSIIGIGINVNQHTFDTELQAKAISLRQATGKDIDRKTILQAVLQELDAQYRNIQNAGFDSVLHEWNKRCTMFGKTANVAREGTKVSGTAVGLSPEGGLILHTAHGMETVYAGDVTVIP